MTNKTTPSPAAAKKAAPAKPTPAKAATVKPATTPAPKPEKVAPPAPADAPVATTPAGKKEKKVKVPKTKVIRDSFTLPQDDYAKIAELKQSCLKAGLHVKKSELIRAGLRLLSRLDATQLHAELDALEKIKTGRPKAS